MKITDPNKDPLGRALLDYMAGRATGRIEVESDVAEGQPIPVGLLFREFGEMPAWERLALELCRGSVLDIGAGSGAHALWLQEQGLPVTALDTSPGAVEVMIQRGVSEVQHQDYTDLKEEQFDTILMLMNGIGVVGSLDGFVDFLFQARDLLRPGGQILFDSSNISTLFEGASGDEDLGQAPFEVEYVMVYKEAISDPFNWLYIDFDLVAEIAKEAGFSAQCLMNGPHHEYLCGLQMMEISSK